MDRVCSTQGNYEKHNLKGRDNLEHWGIKGGDNITMDLREREGEGVD
jgi:hypothetical protein